MIHAAVSNIKNDDVKKFFYLMTCFGPNQKFWKDLQSKLQGRNRPKKDERADLFVAQWNRPPSTYDRWAGSNGRFPPANTVYVLFVKRKKDLTHSRKDNRLLLFSLNVKNVKERCIVYRNIPYSNELYDGSLFHSS